MNRTRRDLFNIGAGAALMPLSSQADDSGPAPVRTKAPRVWLDMDQAELDAAYDQSNWAPNMGEVLQRFATASEDVRSRLGQPQRHIARLSAPLVLAFGVLESPEFQRQSRDFAAVVRAAGKPMELLVAEGYNHFEITETLANPCGLLGRAALAQMGLGPR